MKSYILITVVAMFTFCEPLFSKGFKSSSSFSRSSSSSFKSTPKTSSSKPSSKPMAVKPASTPTSTSTATKPSSKSNVVTQKYKSSTDKVAYEKATKNGTAFKTKEEAISSFKTTHGAKYTSTFPKEPVTRPTYIPQTTNVGGRDYNVSYNQDRGGYGYMNNLGTFMMFDAMTDAVVMSSLMNNHGYYHGSPYQATHPVVSQQSQNVSSGWIVFSVILCVVVFVVVIAIITE